MFKGKKILLAICGSIAAYKSILLLRLLTGEGAEVKVILTPSAKDFVTPLTLSTLSGNKVSDQLFEEGEWSNHVMMGRWADIMIIAPLTCNTLSKMAMGLCDNILLATYLSATCPVMVAPAMDEDMWMHPSTIDNLTKLKSFGNLILPVGTGPLASGLVGPGRMAEPEQIIEYLKEYFFERPLKGKHALVTAGPTYEALDPVRFIGNHSSGKMGVAIAISLLEAGAMVTLILGPSNIEVPKNIEVIRVTSASEMFGKTIPLLDFQDIVIMSAAVADYTPDIVSLEKIKKKEDKFNISLKKTNDILKAAGAQKKTGQILIGFALETNNEKANAIKKLEDKNADIIILNSMNDKEAGFGKDTNKITIFDKNGNETSYEAKNKSEVARDIVDAIIKYSNV